MTPDKASDNLTVQNFRKDCLRELKKIKLAWPGLNYTTVPGVLILHPSTPTNRAVIRAAPPSLKRPARRGSRRRTGRWSGRGFGGREDQRTLTGDPLRYNLLGESETILD